MKARLITNGVLSIISSILYFVAIAFLIRYLNFIVRENSTIANDLGYHETFIEKRKPLSILWTILFFLASFICSIVSLVFGILTLTMEKDKSIEGLTIASGVLAIVGGVFFVNAIVSFIAVSKINKNNKKTLVDIKEG